MISRYIETWNIYWNGLPYFPRRGGRDFFRVTLIWDPEGKNIVFLCPFTSTLSKPSYAFLFSFSFLVLRLSRKKNLYASRSSALRTQTAVIVRRTEVYSRLTRHLLHLFRFTEKPKNGTPDAPRSGRSIRRQLCARHQRVHLQTVAASERSLRVNTRKPLEPFHYLQVAQDIPCIIYLRTTSLPAGRTTRVT